MEREKLIVILLALTLLLSVGSILMTANINVDRAVYNLAQLSSEPSSQQGAVGIYIEPQQGGSE